MKASEWKNIQTKIENIWYIYQIEGGNVEFVIRNIYQRIAQ